jgi:hypothetical protein
MTPPYILSHAGALYRIPRMAHETDEQVAERAWAMVPLIKDTADSRAVRAAASRVLMDLLPARLGVAYDVYHKTNM